MFGVFLLHTGDVKAHLGRVFPLAAFHSEVFLLRQLAYLLFCCQVNTWFCEGKLQESQENYLMIQEGKTTQPVFAYFTWKNFGHCRVC